MFVKSVDEMAKTEKLTRELLLKEVLQNGGSAPFLEESKKQILDDLGCISSRYDLDERVIIYCFIRLLRENKVKKLNFWDAFNNNWIKLVSNYIKQYYSNLNEAQDLLWQ